MTRPPSISPSELSVLSDLWDHPRSAGTEVHARLSGETGWSVQTVKTMLARLTDKGAVRAERDGRRFLYTAVLERGTYAREATRSLASKLFKGRAAPLVANLVEDAPLSDEDLSELEALVARMRAERGS